MLPEEMKPVTHKEKRYVIYIAIAIISTVALIYVFFQFDNFANMIATVASAFTPFFSGLVVAFILNTFVNSFDGFLFKPLNKKFENGKVWNKIRKPVSLCCAYLLTFAIIALLLLFIIPDLIISIDTFIANASEVAPVYLENIFNWIDGLFVEYNINLDMTTLQNEFLSAFNWSAIISEFSLAATSILTSVLAVTLNIFSILFTVLMSLIYSAYFLSGKKNLITMFKKMLYAYIPKKAADKTSLFLTVSNNIFSSFVRGQLTECVILASLCYIGMTIIGLEYALLISAILGLTALIPVFGAFIGAGLGVLLLLLVNPMDAIWFLIFILILQQFEGNVIYPKVVGSSIGLPGLWTLTAVLVFGALFGVLGILLGTPITAVVYTLLRHTTNKRIKDKGITKDVLEGDELRIIYSDILIPEERETIQEDNGLMRKVKKVFKK